MVKGISRQVIVVHSPDPKLFDQAIFILNDEAVNNGVTDEALMKEAIRLINTSNPSSRRQERFAGPVWAFGGGLLIGIAWLLSSLL